MESVDKLKPCPLCGGEAHIEHGLVTWAVVCPCSSHVFYGYEKSQAKTAEAWNTRAERTCTIEYWRGEYVCTACGNAVGDDDPWSENFVNGNAVEMWAYCPNCGAKVVDE